MAKCRDGCTCGRHRSYERTPEMRAAQSARQRGVGRTPVAERFWKKVAKRGPNDCWLWTGAIELSGYGKLYAGRSDRGISLFVGAHRLSWEIANGRSVPDGLHVLHSCDIPLCVNPAHLRAGSNTDNVGDRSQRRRGKEHRQRGEANDNAKLTEVQVREIIAELRRLPRRSQAAIAADFGIKQPQVSRIMLRQSWAHLWDE